ncbi:hypothetical protein [Bradyrhizobium sp. Arg816]|uniref:hypothetical protein n=1 Tax=Bradyrhizobium sp. Arg816 TaxID=2998491 RepID=UPI00249EC772|nr:hypothetical protein [Bradyrhizobium sp. Arg816]MDI3564303.1 hypothetical protein [Bradyrhizobium sp. Arg816]
MKFPAGRDTCCVRSQHAARRDPETGYARHRLVLRSIAMMDILMLALGFVFFALAIGYTYACERL